MALKVSVENDGRMIGVTREDDPVTSFREAARGYLKELDQEAAAIEEKHSRLIRALEDLALEREDMVKRVEAVQFLLGVPITITKKIPTVQVEGRVDDLPTGTTRTGMIRSFVGANSHNGVSIGDIRKFMEGYGFTLTSKQVSDYLHNIKEAGKLPNGLWVIHTERNK